jgi:glycosyltransferase involved in cell wall biosynthesis
MRPKVSVIIPVFNGENYLSRCLQSVCQQTIPEVEIIVINDGSTDGTSRVVSTFIKSYPWVRLIDLPTNMGVSYARNWGIKEATGEYLTFVDGDDSIHPNMLEQMYHSAIYHQVPLMICSFSYGEGNQLDVCDPHYLNSQDYLRNMLVGHAPRTACGILFKKEFVISNQLRFQSTLNYGEDFIFTIEALMKSENLCYLDTPYYQVKLRRNSASRLTDLYHINNVVKIEQELKRLFRGNVPLTKEVSVYLQTEAINALEKIVFAHLPFSKRTCEINKLKRNQLFLRYICQVDPKVSGRKIKRKSTLIKRLPSPLLIFLYLFVIRMKL